MLVTDSSTNPWRNVTPCSMEQLPISFGILQDEVAQSTKGIQKRMLESVSKADTTREGGYLDASDYITNGVKGETLEDTLSVQLFPPGRYPLSPNLANALFFWLAFKYLFTSRPHPKDLPTSLARL